MDSPNLENFDPIGNEVSQNSSEDRLAVSRRGAMLTIAALGVGAVSSRLNASQPFALTTSPAAAAAQNAATAWLKLLDEKQQAIAKIAFDDKKRLDWHFIPMPTRKGLTLREMNEAQQQAAIDLLGTVLSERGFTRAKDIIAYESILLHHEGPAAAARRDYQKYHFAIYGTPSADGVWGLSIEGHHLSLNFTFDKGVIGDSTPQFFGVNPAQLQRDYSTPNLSKLGATTTQTMGKRLLAEEEDAGFDLVKSLDAQQQAKAIYSSECPDDIQWAGEVQPKPGAQVGIRAKELNSDQTNKLWALINAYLATMPAEVAEQRIELIRKAGVDQIYFGWAGATEKGKQHFFRLQGPTFIAELCNFQTDPEQRVANHIHSIWRDMTGDFYLPLVS